MQASNSILPPRGQGAGRLPNDGAPDGGPALASLRRRTLVGIFWSGLGNYGASAARLVSLLALGWLLPATDFGLLAIALMFVTFAGGIGELGLGAALVQQKEVDRSALSSVFWFGLLVHLLLAAATVRWAEPITALLGDAAAASLLRLLAAVFVIDALSLVPRTILVRDLTFREVSMARLTAELGFGVVGLALAALGFGALSFGGAILAQRIVNAIVLWRAVPWRPRLAIEPAVLGGLLRFGGPVVGGTIVERALLNVDYLVISRLVGTEPLGYYAMACQLALLPLDRLVGLAAGVAFPAFSRVQGDIGRLGTALREGLRHLSIAAVPIVLGIVVLGPWLLAGVYGEKWLASVASLRILGLAGLCFLPRLAETALLAVGRPMLRMWLLILRLAVFGVLVGVIGVRHGIEGVAASVAGALLVWAGATLLLGTRILGIRWGEIGVALWPAARAGAAAIAPLALFLLLGGELPSPWIALACAGAVMAAIYGALVLPLYGRSLVSWFRSKQR